MRSSRCAILAARYIAEALLTPGQLSPDKYGSEHLIRAHMRTRRVRRTTPRLLTLQRTVTGQVRLRAVNSRVHARSLHPPDRSSPAPDSQGQVRLRAFDSRAHAHSASPTNHASVADTPTNCHRTSTAPSSEFARTRALVASAGQIVAGHRQPGAFTLFPRWRSGVAARVRRDAKRTLHGSSQKRSSC
jgi:hypothetical protein